MTKRPPKRRAAAKVRLANIGVKRVGLPSAQPRIVNNPRARNKFDTDSTVEPPKPPLSTFQHCEAWRAAQIEKYGADDPWVMKYATFEFQYGDAIDGLRARIARLESPRPSLWRRALRAVGL